MKKKLLLLVIPFLFSCNNPREETVIPGDLIPVYPMKSTLHEMVVNYKEDKAEVILSDNQLVFSKNDVYDAKKDQIDSFIPGDVLEFLYVHNDDEKNNYKSILIHKAYILELNKTENGYYSEVLDINFDANCIDKLNYIIKDVDYRYESIENINVNDKIYATIKEDDFLNKSKLNQELSQYALPFSSVFSFNPRNDNSLMIKNVIKCNNHQPIYNNYLPIINNVSETDELVIEKERYNESFFENNSLIVLYFNENSGSISHSIKRVQKLDNGLDIFVDVNRPEIGDCSMAYWQIVIEVEKIPSSLKINLFTY